MGNAPQETQLPAESTVSATSTGKARHVTSLTAGTTAGALTTATVTSPERNCVCVMRAGKVRGSFPTPRSFGNVYQALYNNSYVEIILKMFFQCFTMGER